MPDQDTGLTGNENQRGGDLELARVLIQTAIRMGIDPQTTGEIMSQIGTDMGDNLVKLIGDNLQDKSKGIGE